MVVITPDNTINRTYFVVVNRGMVNGVEDVTNRPLVAYPNPARERVIISGLGGNGGILSMFDAAGKQWIHRKIASSEETIFVSNMLSRTYFVQVIDGKKVRTIKLTVEQMDVFKMGCPSTGLYQ